MRGGKEMGLFKRDLTIGNFLSVGRLLKAVISGLKLETSNNRHIHSLALLLVVTVCVVCALAALPTTASAELRAYVPNYDDDTVSVIRISDNSVIATISVGDGPFGARALPGGRYVYVSNELGNTVSVIRTSDNTIIKTIIVGNGPRTVFKPWQDSLSDYIYVSNHGENTISVIRASDHTLASTLTVGNGPGPIGGAHGPDQKHIYVSNMNDSTISVIDTTSNSVVQNIPVGNGPRGMKVDIMANFLYVPDHFDNTVSVIRLSDNAVVSTIAVGRGPAEMSQHPNGIYMFVTNRDDDTVSIIRTSDYTVEGTIAVGDGPTRIARAWGPGINSNILYVANIYAGTISVIDANSNSVITTIDVRNINVSDVPPAMPFTPDYSYLYVSNTASNTVSVIRTSDHTVAETITVGNGPRAIAFADVYDGLVAYYPFEGNALDVSGNDNNGTEKGGVTYTNGVLGQAASFDGVDDYIDVADSATLDISGNELTIAAWVKPDQTGFDSHAIVSKYFGDGYYLRVNPDGSVDFSARGTLQTNVGVVAPGNFVHVVGTSDGTNSSIYVNGQLISSGQTCFPGPCSITPTEHPLTIGAWPISHDMKFKGTIDELRIYNRALSETEIQGLYLLGGDTDGDSVPDAADNCPDVPNPTQADINGNEIGDACDGFGVFDPSYMTDLDLAFTAIPAAVQETADIAVTSGGVLSRTATGYISGDATLNLNKGVHIKNGTYAGWGYQILDYSLVSSEGMVYNGKVHGVHYQNEVWAMTSGDIHAVVRSHDNGDHVTWQLSSIKGMQTTGTINFLTTNKLAGITDNYPGETLTIYDGVSQSGAASGYYSGSYQQTLKVLILPFLNGEGFVTGTYQSDLGSGSVYMYRDLSASPQVIVSGIREGALSGLWEASFQNPASIGTPMDAQIEHAFGSAEPDSDGDGCPDFSDGCPDDSNKIAPGPAGCGNLDTTIPPQTNITAIPAAGVSITFSEITSPGVVTANQTTSASLPRNFAVVGRVTFDVSFTGTMTGPLTLCFSYEESNVQDESNLRLLHFESSSWLDITTFIDTTLNKICGQTYSLSPFIVVEPDTDGDGMPDSWETDNGLNPNDSSDASQDTLDSDGLTNLEEYQNGTNPSISDTDSDGLTDGEEVNSYGTNPNLADTDGDGVNDGIEIANETNPLVNENPPSVVHQVPVHTGLWMIPSIVTGLYFLRRRSKIS